MDEPFHTAWEFIKSRRKRERGIDGLEYDTVVPSEEMDDQTWDEWSEGELEGRFDEEEDKDTDEPMGASAFAGLTPEQIAAHNLKLDSLIPKKEEPDEMPEERSITAEELNRLMGLD